MMPLISSLEKLAEKDFNVMKDMQAVEAEIKKNTNIKIFLMETSIVQLANDTGKLIIEPCGKVSVNEEISKVFKLLETYEYILVTGKKGLPAGYISRQQLPRKLYEIHQQLQAYISTILETIDESCTVIDREQKVVAWTKGAEQIFSVKKEEIIGKPITDFFSPDRLEILKTLSYGTSLHHSQHKARENQVVLINSNPVYLNKEIIGAVVSETDITSQLKLNKELYDASQKLFTLEKEVRGLLPSDNPFLNIRGNSKALKQVIGKIKKAASTDAHILIHGESGVGKELFAKSAHMLREGANSPFIAINCGAIPSSLFESEIFGYEKGAFSGADQKGKKGKVELAKGGTLFLDEIGEMPLEMQVKLLRLLQERKFYPVGGTKEITVDFRLIAATNRNLRELVNTGKFREDLYYRLNVVSIEIPPLRKRPEDIIELTHYFLHELSIKYNRPIHGISQHVMQGLLLHNWPGNIRELKNVVERLVVFSEDGEINLADLPFETDLTQQTNGHTFTPGENDNRPLSERVHELEKEIIIKELQKCDGNKLECAKKLQITRATLYNRINKLGIKI